MAIQTIQSQKVGSFANSNLQSIAHSTLIFADAPTDEDDVIRNGVYLTPHQLPKITIGTTIDYLVNGRESMDKNKRLINACLGFGVGFK